MKRKKYQTKESECDDGNNEGNGKDRRINKGMRGIIYGYEDQTKKLVKKI